MFFSVGRELDASRVEKVQVVSDLLSVTLLGRCGGGVEWLLSSTPCGGCRWRFVLWGVVDERLVRSVVGALQEGS